jgi:hypothetical protein
MVIANHKGRCVVVWNVPKFFNLNNIHVLSFVFDPMVGIDHRGNASTICDNLINIIVDNYGR